MVNASELENPLERRCVWGRETRSAVSDSHKNLRNERIGLSTFKCMSRKKNPITEKKVTGSQSWENFEKIKDFGGYCRLQALDPEILFKHY